MGLILLKKTDGYGLTVSSAVFTEVFSVDIHGQDGFVLDMAAIFAVNQNGVLIGTRVSLVRWNAYLQDGAIGGRRNLSGGVMCPPRDVIRLARDVGAAQTLKVEAMLANPGTSGLYRPVNLQIACYGVELDGESSGPSPGQGRAS